MSALNKDVNRAACRKGVVEIVGFGVGFVHIFGVESSLNRESQI
jgi:hypothetical protein